MHLIRLMFIQAYCFVAVGTVALVHTWDKSLMDKLDS